MERRIARSRGLKFRSSRVIFGVIPVSGIILVWQGHHEKVAGWVPFRLTREPFVSLKDARDPRPEILDVMKLVEDVDQGGVPIGLHAFHDLLQGRLVNAARIRDSHLVVEKLDLDVRANEIVAMAKGVENRLAKR